MSAAVPSSGREFFPQGCWLQVLPTAVQGELRRAFRRWGLPQAFRVDNGGPWGSDGDWPPDLALWLLGLGVAVHYNDPRAPAQNGVIERSQGTAKRWAEPWQCDHPAELQRRLQRMDTIQRERYPSLAGRSRSAVYPELAQGGRVYSAAWERQHWSQRRVLEHLAQYTAPRRVDKNGDVSLYHRPHYVGCRHRGETVFVTVDPRTAHWVFVAADGRQLRSQPAEELSAARIRSLTVSNRA
jgi:hypothetical protein